MDKIDFLCGKEERFAEFIKNLNEKEKIAIVTHTDIDGIVAGKMADLVLDSELLKFVNYEDLTQSLVEELKKGEIKKVIFTDLFFKDISLIKSIEKFADILIIDHHKVSQDLNSEKTVYLNSQGYCAAYLSYYLFSKISNLEKYDWLVACACIADWCYTKNHEWMEEIYNKYGDKFIPTIEGIKAGKVIWPATESLSLTLIYFDTNLNEVYNILPESLEEIKKLDKYTKEVRKEIDESLEKFEKEKIAINDGYFWELNPHFPIKSYLITNVSGKINDKTMIFGTSKDKTYSLSARRQDGKVDMDILMKTLVSGFKDSNGGGHAKAAGAFVQLKDKEELRKRILAL